MGTTVTITEDELKTEFARALLQTPNDAFKAARCVFGEDTGMALRVASTWVIDPFVIAERARLADELPAREALGLPTKEAYARKLYDWIEDSENKLYIPFEDKLKLVRLFGEVMGYIERPAQTTINNNNSVNHNRVMIVKDAGNNEDWERKLREHQQKLIEDASAVRH